MTDNAPTVSGVAPIVAGDKPTTAMMAPVPVTIIGSMTDAIPTTGTIATTPGAAQPNLRVVIITPLVAISVRFANTFGVALFGLLTAAMTPAGGKLLYTSDFYHLVLMCSSLSIPVAGLGLVKDVTTLLSGWEKKFPLATGSI